VANLALTYPSNPLFSAPLNKLFGSDWQLLELAFYWIGYKLAVLPTYIQSEF